MVRITLKIKKLIEGNALGFATVDLRGNPHCIAVGDIKVVLKNHLLVGDHYLVETVKNIRRNKNVALVVWNKNWKENCVGYELKGKARYFTSGKWLKMVKKIHKGFPGKGAILVKVSKLKKLA